MRPGRWSPVALPVRPATISAAERVRAGLLIGYVRHANSDANGGANDDDNKLATSTPPTTRDMQAIRVGQICFCATFGRPELCVLNSVGRAHRRSGPLSSHGASSLRARGRRRAACIRAGSRQRAAAQHVRLVIVRSENKRAHSIKFGSGGRAARALDGWLASGLRAAPSAHTSLCFAAPESLPLCR